MKRHALMKTAATIIMATAIPMTAMANVAKTESVDSVKVSFSDLDMKNPMAQKVLYRRLKLAANEVCGPVSVHQAGSFSDAREGRQCYRQALDKAVSELNMPAIKALHHR